MFLSWLWYTYDKPWVVSNWLLNWLLASNPFNSWYTDVHGSNDFTATNMSFSDPYAVFDGSTSDLYIASWSSYERSAWDFTIAFVIKTTKNDNMFIKTSERWWTGANDYWYDIYTSSTAIMVRTSNGWDGAWATTSASFSSTARKDWSDHLLLVTFDYNGSNNNVVEVFLDNSSLGTNSSGKNIVYNSRWTYVGTYYWTWTWAHPFTNDFSGSMKLLNFRDRILTSDERTALYNGGAFLTYPLFTY